MTYENHLYMILFPMNALVGSQLDPQAFAKHFNFGSSKFYSGKMIYAELDINFRHPYFNLDEKLKDLKPHEDGRPKSTKYFSTYRVLEHVDYSAIKKLYISTPEGYVLELDEGPYEAKHQTGYIRVFAEVAPMSLMVLSDYNFLEYANFITQPDCSVGAPKMFYTQVELDITDFLEELEKNPMYPSPIPDLHPSVLRDSIRELQKFKNKHTKGLALTTPLGKMSFRNLRHGFMFASQDKNRFFPLPPMAEIEKNNFKFYKYM